MLGIELSFSGRVASALNHGVISPGYINKIFKKEKKFENSQESILREKKAFLGTLGRQGCEGPGQTERGTNAALQRQMQMGPALSTHQDLD